MRIFSKISVILFLIFNLLSINALAQGESFFSARRELSSSLVNHIMQDDDGLVWISTENGLNVYDGVKFWHIYHSDTDSLSLLNNYVRLVFQDSGKRIFVGTIQGLQLFDKKTQDYYRIPVLDDNGKRVPKHLSISSVCELPDGRYLVGVSGAGVYTMESDGNGFFCLRPFHTIDNLYVERIVSDNAGNIWIAYLNGDIQILDSSLKVSGQVRLKASETAFAICPDVNGNVLVGTSIGRVLSFAKDSTSYTQIVSESQNDYSVLDFLFNPDGVIYMATDGSGIKVLSPQVDGNYKLEDFEFVSMDNGTLKVHSIMRDRDNNLWFGCFQRGVILKPCDRSMFDYVGQFSYKNNVIGQCCVMSLCYDDKHNLLVGTDNDGIYLLGPDYKFIRHYDCRDKSSLVPKVTLSIYQDSRGRIWVGGYLGGLVYLDPKSGKWTRYPLSNSDRGDNFPSVYAIVEDEATHTLWASASGVGLYKIDLNTLSSKCFNIKDEHTVGDFNINQLPNSWVNCLCLSSDRKLYIGTYTGFSCLDLETDSFTSTFSTNCMLDKYIVNSIFEDVNHHIWLGTTNGLFDFDPSICSFKLYTIDDGLSSNSITAVSGDSDGNIWMASKGGISCLDIKMGSFVNYYAADGLYGTEYQQNAVAQSDEGNIAFGSVDGVVSFYPFKGRVRTRKLSASVVNFVVGNIPLHFGSMSGGNMVMDTTVFCARRFHLAHFDNSFDIEFSAMQFDNPESMTYYYRLDDGPWIVMAGSRVSFARLGYGVHKIEAKVSDAVSTSDPTTVYVEIDYPWYRSWWNYLLLCFLLLSVIGVMIMVARRRYLLHEELKEVARTKEINDSRLEYFTNISHEIRTPMSLIVSPLYKLMGGDPDPERQRSYKIINQNAQRVLNLINQLMDLRKIDNSQLVLKFQETDLVAFVRNVYDSFELFASQNGVDFQFKCDMETMAAYIDPLNFDKVIVNLLSNAFKYTPKGRSVVISLAKTSDAAYRITVVDSGTGIQESDIPHIFDLFYQGDNSHKIGIVGTGVGMYLTRQLVEMHGGQISVTNNSNSQGCQFTIDLPLGRAHLTDSQIIVPDDNVAVKPEQSQASSHIAQLPLDEEFLKQYAKSKFRIIVVDDDEQIRKYIVSELSVHFHVTDFSNAEEAWKAVVTSKPDLIVSDVMMGEGQMTGLSFCKKIKQNLEVNHIPVVLLTAMAQDDNRIRGLDVGADAFIAKPFNISVLVHTITNLLKKNITLKNRYLGRQEHSKNVDNVDIKSPDERLLQRVMKVINENISNPNLTVEMIAAEVGISRVHLHRKLKELTNQSTLDFLRNVRLNVAVKLLEKHHHSILEVAQQVGFVSTAYFSTVFKDRFGMTPTAYMNEHSGQPRVDSDTSGDNN